MKNGGVKEEANSTGSSEGTSFHTHKSLCLLSWYNINTLKNKNKRKQLLQDVQFNRRVSARVRTDTAFERV